MARRLRFLPPGSLVEVTGRTLQSRFLLHPSPELNRTVVGVLAKARELYTLELHAASFLSTHYHLLMTPADAAQMAAFMAYVASNLAREIAHLHDWPGKVWGRRYQHVVVSDEPEAQEARLLYLLSQGVKENLVARPEDWPGVQVVGALTRGETLRGEWRNRTAEYRLRREGIDPHRESYIERLELELAPLPCWAELDIEERQQRAQELVDQIEHEAAVRHAADGTRPAGVAAVRARHPHERPKSPKRSPAPLIHAASKEARRLLREAYRLFLEAYYEASARLRAGDRDVVFPDGCFPPALPFVPPAPPEPG